VPEVPSGHFYLGEYVDAAAHERTGDPVMLEASDLTTHGVIVGMTGSGKTGLAMGLLEEALLQKIPIIAIDPKGDLGNLLLSFPDLAPADFEPWLDPAILGADGDANAIATEKADTWRKGLDSWGIGPERIAELRAETHMALYTPGSDAGIPIDLIGGLNAPPPDADQEAVSDEIQNFVSSLLGLIGMNPDPLADREHILCTNLIAHAWSEGRNLDVGQLIVEIQNPPIRRLGVIELETFYPAADRMKLALRLNGLLASPAFAAWTQGAALDVDKLLYRDGTPCASIISIAHLDDAERQFVVTLLLSKIITWMRSQAGTSELRALIYMDEVFGFVPPTANPPSKQPILTILKQARAFGLGMVLATQNPVDVDYKAISNAGTWMIGRLQTERDKMRLLDGMTSAGGAVDTSAVGDAISGLDSREFVLHSTRSDGPKVFGTRWAMSYLSGPLTRDQIRRLTADAPERSDNSATDAPAPLAAAGAAGAAAPNDAPAEGTVLTPPPRALADDEVGVMPPIADTVEVVHLHPSAEWAGLVDAVAGGQRLLPMLAARVHLRYDDTKLDLDTSQEWEALIPLTGKKLDVDGAIAVDYDDRDFTTEAPVGASYVVSDAPIKNKTYFTSAKVSLRDHLLRTKSVEVLYNKPLKLASRPDETPEDFTERCAEAADAGGQAELDKLRSKYDTKKDRLAAAVSKAQDRVREQEESLESREQENKLGALTEAADVLGGMLGLGGRRKRSLGAAGRRLATKRGAEARSAERLVTAENRLSESIDALDDFEQELLDSIEDVNRSWDDKMEQIETVQVGLERTDITVDEMMVVWVPTA